VSVVHRPKEGFSVIFMNSVRDLVTDEIKDHVKSLGFSISFVG